MEQGSTVGTDLAYAAIVLFLVLIGLVLARTMLLTSVLLFAPIRRIWTWLVGGFGGRRRPE